MAWLLASLFHAHRVTGGCHPWGLLGLHGLFRQGSKWSKWSKTAPAVDASCHVAFATLWRFCVVGGVEAFVVQGRETEEKWWEINGWTCAHATTQSTCCQPVVQPKLAQVAHGRVPDNLVLQFQVPLLRECMGSDTKRTVLLWSACNASSLTWRNGFNQFSHQEFNESHALNSQFVKSDSKCITMSNVMEQHVHSHPWIPHHFTYLMLIVCLRTKRTQMVKASAFRSGSGAVSVCFSWSTVVPPNIELCFVPSRKVQKTIT